MKQPNALRTGFLIAAAALMVTSCAASQGGGVETAEQAAPPPPPHPIEAAPAEPVVQAAVSELPEGAGRETTIRVCSGCHAVELVAEKHLTRQEWFDLVQFMGDRGATGTPAEMAEITDYLARSFPKQ
jgi:cytochrome c5